MANIVRSLGGTETMSDLEKLWVSINCPKCNFEFEIQVLNSKLQEIVYCHNCKCSIRLVDETASAHSAIRNIKQAFRDIDDLFK